MPSLKDIRLRIKSIQNTQQTTKAMKMVSAAKLRKAQDTILQLRPYAAKLKDLQVNLIAGVDPETFANPYAEVRAAERVLVVVVSSNKGLCGGFNSAILRIAHQHIHNNYQAQYDAGNVALMTLGKKAFEYFKKRGYNIVANHDVLSRINFAQIGDVAQEVMDAFTAGTYDRVDLVYNEFKNVAAQNRIVEALLPIKVEGDGGATAKQDLYIFEPNEADILSELIPKSLKIQLYKAILESNASEHGARMVAMDNATENAEELLAELKLTFNKARQAAITKEILEIVGGAEALSGE